MPLCSPPTPLLARLAAKIAAYICAQRINDTLGRPLRHLADLLV